MAEYERELTVLRLYNTVERFKHTFTPLDRV